MPKDKTASHARVLVAAREEFLAYGFEKASMRHVGERCGLTAAGLYRHCRDKADLFDLLVSPAIGQLNAWMENHLARYLTAVREDGTLQWQDSWIDMMREVVYPHVEDYHLLLSAYVTALFEPVIHRYSLEESMKCLETIEAFFLPGWKTLFGF